MTTQLTKPIIYGSHESLNPENWIPLDYAHPRGTAAPGRHISGEMAIVRTTGVSSPTHLVGLWRAYPGAPGCDPVTGETWIPWNAALGDETIYIIEGTVTITIVETGESRKYGPGDIISQTQGMEIEWQVDGPFFKKLFCITAGSELPAPFSEFAVNCFGD